MRPDGPKEQYYTKCKICNAEVKCNMQGNIYDHDCLLCGTKPPVWESQDKTVFCNREKNHPGGHCRQLLNETGYHNIWWTKE